MKLPKLSISTKRRIWAVVLFVVVCGTIFFGTGKLGGPDVWRAVQDILLPEIQNEPPLTTAPSSEVDHAAD